MGRRRPVYSMDGRGLVQPPCCAIPARMAHPLKQRINQLTNAELDDLESVLGAVLHGAQEDAAWLLTEEGRQVEDWEGDDAVTTAYITILNKVLGIEPPVKN
jgi:hypothetical protein